MKTTILEIYAMVICLLTISCFAIALGIGFYDLVQIKFPGFTAVGHGIEIETTRATQSLVKIAIILLVDVIIFMPHWMIGKKAREARAS